MISASCAWCNVRKTFSMLTPTPRSAMEVRAFHMWAEPSLSWATMDVGQTSYGWNWYTSPETQDSATTAIFHLLLSFDEPTLSSLVVPSFIFWLPDAEDISPLSFIAMPFFCWNFLYIFSASLIYLKCLNTRVCDLILVLRLVLTSWLTITHKVFSVICHVCLYICLINASYLVFSGLCYEVYFVSQ